MNRGRHVVATESVAGGRLVATHAFFGDTGAEALERARAHERRKLGTLGQPPAPSLVWQPVPAASDYAFAQGGRYAVLASVSKDYSLAQVRSYLTGHGWTVTYAWEQGTPTRNTYPVDQWLAGLAPDTTSNHRWLYAEANRTGPDVTIGASSPWPFTFYAISDVMVAVAAPPSAAPASPTLPSSPAVPSPARPSAAPVALGVVIVGTLAAAAYVVFRRLL